MVILVYLFCLWLLCIALMLLFFARDLQALWREPVLKCPVMIVESDDWGAGPVSQAAALNRLASILGSNHDSMGRNPVMTIAVALAIPDGAKIEDTGTYHRKLLSDPELQPILHALQSGIERDLFSPQLHGLEHYWPPTLMSCDDPEVQDWLRQAKPQATEKLPSHLQSRWIDASRLPSTHLGSQQIAAAVAEEISLYSSVLGQSAQIVVPPTFIWDDEVEASWSKNGVEFVVTPGRRYSCRDTDGQPSCTGSTFRNGDKSRDVTYLVRNDYFEPERGHDAGRALAAMETKTSQGRPCLLETHRSNFLGKSAEGSFTELNNLMVEVTKKYPDLLHMSTLELGQAISEGKEDLVELQSINRLLPWLSRAADIPRFYKLARIAGLMFVMSLLARLAVSLSTPQPVHEK